MNKTLLLLIPVLALMAACSKKKENDPIGNRQQMLRNTTWQVAEIRDNGSVMPLGCKADDLWIFPADDLGTLDDGNDRCSNEENTQFNYGISGDQRDLYLWNMTNRTTYGSHISHSIAMKWNITYMTPNRLEFFYYDQGDNPSDKEHFYEVRLRRVQ